MTVILFSPRFAPLVEHRTKLQTIRKERKRPIKVGDILSLREWTGKPYCSKQRILRPETPCIGVYKITINDDAISSWPFLVLEGIDSFARDDGFIDWLDMKKWFSDTHGLPFTGVLIRWLP